MLMIYFAIFTLFLASRVSVLATPLMVYSALTAPTIVNLTLAAPTIFYPAMIAPAIDNLTLTVSVIDYPTLVAPAIVYSAVIYNAQRSIIQCTIFRSQPSGPILRFGPITIKKREHHLIKEVTYDMGTWTATAIIQKIQCGNLVVNAPFDNVTSPVKNWEFRVEGNKIVSVGPSSYNTDN
ncbi:unnamed protein product [Rotaria magnacalcarata]|uniref:Uncharacterized protein n=1 Tax=Rotaria magnacalcarata TaxID=392030 RepID=A0A816Z8Y2_9BILA|nr:unnamed protein product [Rotaria magnacalcarata]CAF2190798.1 unnamed protein product [Rotaria magnacalcarata]CAF4259018.1 unnamed protein product [Rotaria magnacalcarata]CAF4283800.1 unnamed protein product [Rotaria magnacalcarata]